jgi:F0F1-type ATP synthase assembly protein I
VQQAAQRRLFNRAFGDALATAFEFAATVAIFFAIGYGLDRWFGTTPVFMVVLFLFALIGKSVKLFFTYSADLERDVEARREAARPNPNGAAR